MWVEKKKFNVDVGTDRARSDARQLREQFRDTSISAEIVFCVFNYAQLTRLFTRTLSKWMRINAPADVQVGRHVAVFFPRTYTYYGNRRTRGSEFSKAIAQLKTGHLLHEFNGPVHEHAVACFRPETRNILGRPSVDRTDGR